MCSLVTLRLKMESDGFLTPKSRTRGEFRGRANLYFITLKERKDYEAYKEKRL